MILDFFEREKNQIKSLTWPNGSQEGVFFIFGKKHPKNTPKKHPRNKKKTPKKTPQKNTNFSNIPKKHPKKNTNFRNRPKKTPKKTPQKNKIEKHLKNGHF